MSFALQTALPMRTTATFSRFVVSFAAFSFSISPS